MSYEIAKIDEDECLVFGFANVSVSKRTASGEGGEVFKDLQGDLIEPAQLEKAAYTHVLEFREADEMHRGSAKGQLVESIVFTHEKLEAFAKDENGVVNQEHLAVLKQIFPPRWWVGYKFDKEAFAGVKSGKYTMFSIAGEADAEKV